MLTASHLTRRFDDRVAVDDVSFELVGGEIFALLGPNGAGKTTTLRMLSGLIEPSDGSVRIDGRTMSRRSAGSLRGRIGLLTEAPGLWDRLSVWRNLLTYARLQGLSEPRRVVDEALERFNLFDRRNDLAAQLSKGLKQRVAIARTLLHQPAIVLLDEPTSGLDPESARDVRNLILELKREGRAILLSTHNLDEVDRIADRVGIMRSRLIALDTPAALRSRLFGAKLHIVLSQPANTFVPVLRGTDVAQVEASGVTLSITIDSVADRTPDIVRKLVLAGADIQRVEPEEPPLEEIYLRLLREPTEVAS